MRLLIQDRDGFSIRELAKKVYQRDDVPEEYRNRFNEQRCKWGRHTACASMFKHVTEDRNFTNGELFDILLYGGLAHVSGDKVDLFRRLTTQGFYSSLLCGSFLSSLGILLEVVRAIRRVNEELLQH